MITSEELKTILAKGILAPSADNLQPWKFRVRRQRTAPQQTFYVDLFLDQARVQNFCDTGLLAPYISAGAVIENLRVASRCKGYQLAVTYFPDKPDPFYVASLRLDPVIFKDHTHETCVERRVTNRKFYENRQTIDQSVYSRLEQLADVERKFELTFIRKSSPKYSKLVRIVGEADKLRFEIPRLHRELMALMRMNPKEAEETQDGLDLRTLESGPGGSLLFNLIRSWERLNLFNRLGMSRLFGFYASLQMLSSQAAGLLVAPSQSSLDYVRGGELMERIWHEATNLGLAIQPMEALPIFIMNLQQNQIGDFTKRQKEKLNRLKEEFFSLFVLQEENALIFLFRLGYAPSPAYRSLRRNLESFLLSDSDVKV
ncbi:MAG: hypothetical protein NC930_02985 [Candidatus Omnitrophica bacterium]|nr:hypothetical protein [Candidatus Omnitrophota bacterium]